MHAARSASRSFRIISRLAMAAATGRGDPECVEVIEPGE